MFVITKIKLKYILIKFVLLAYPVYINSDRPRYDYILILKQEGNNMCYTFYNKAKTIVVLA